MATADLLVLVLRVLPEEIRKWLNAERNLPGKRKEEVGHVWLGARESGIWTDKIAGGERSLFRGLREKGA